MKINVKIKPSKEEQKIVKNNDYIVYLKSAPRDNKANIELIKLLKKYFGKNVRIKSGLFSRNKIIEIFN